MPLLLMPLHCILNAMLDKLEQQALCGHDIYWLTATSCSAKQAIINAYVMHTGVSLAMIAVR